MPPHNPQGPQAHLSFLCPWIHRRLPFRASQERELFVVTFVLIMASVPSWGSMATVQVVETPRALARDSLGLGLSASLGRDHISGSWLGRDISGCHLVEEGCSWHLTGSRSGRLQNVSQCIVPTPKELPSPVPVVPWLELGLCDQSRFSGESQRQRGPGAAPAQVEGLRWTWHMITLAPFERSNVSTNK